MTSIQKAHRLTVLVGLLIVASVTLFAFTACNRASEHPDEKDAVNSAMTSNGLGVVKVSQDREKGVITLTGDVESAEQKTRAESVAKQAAPDYVIADDIGIRPLGVEGQAKAVDSSLDGAIEDNYKAALKAHKSLDDQSISYDAKNGTLVLKGSVKTTAQKKRSI